MQAKRVLLVIEDVALGEMLADALGDSGHHASLLPEGADLGRAVGDERFDAVIVDLDSRARDGERHIALVRSRSPSTTVIALLPCGGLPADRSPPPYHLALEQPARLKPLLLALAADPRNSP